MGPLIQGEGKMICRRWTKEEDEFLVTNYGKLSFEEKAIKLGRSIHAIAQRCTGTLKLINKPHGKTWTDEEIQILNEKYGKIIEN